MANRVPKSNTLKTHRKCKSYFILLRNKNSDMAIVKYLGCDRTDCPSCQRDKADKYYKEWIRLGMSIMYWKEVTDKEYKSLSLKAYRSGDYYFRCALDNGNTIIVTTYAGKACRKCGASDWGGELIGPDDDLKAMLREWVSHQRLDSNVSSSYKAVKEQKEWEKVATIKSTRRSELDRLAQYADCKQSKDGLFTGVHVDDFVLAVQAVI